MENKDFSVTDSLSSQNPSPTEKIFENNFSSTKKNLSAEVKELFDSFWEFRLEHSPEFATSLGIHKFDDKLESYSLETLKCILVNCEEFLRKVENLLEIVRNNEQRRFLSALAYELKTYIAGFEYKGYFFPISHLEGLQLNFEEVIKSMPTEKVSHYENIISRYKEFPVQVDEVIELMKEGVKCGMVLCKHSLKNINSQFECCTNSNLEESVFYEPFKNISLEDSEAEKIRGEAKKAIQDFVIPSFQKLEDYVVNIYSKQLRSPIAITTLPNGEEYYKQCLRFHTGTDFTAEEIHNIGIQEVERIEDKMHRIIENFNFDLTVQEFSEKLRLDENLHFENKAAIRREFLLILEEKISPKLTNLFNFIPKMKLDVGFVPDTSPNAPAANYTMGNPSGTRPAVIVVNGTNPKQNSKFEAPTLCLHEGNPGHHLYSCYLWESEDIPSFLRRRETNRKYNVAPSRFPLHTAFLEGWGLYAETLGEDLGVFQDDFDRYGHLSEEIFRACRLVVDTGIHSFNWTRDEAINYMKLHSAASVGRIENEVDRYITWPGQACAYKIGQMKILEQRRLAQERLGDKFDIRRFHDTILSCSVGCIKKLQKCLVHGI